MKKIEEAGKILRYTSFKIIVINKSRIIQERNPSDNEFMVKKKKGKVVPGAEARDESRRGLQRI